MKKLRNLFQNKSYDVPLGFFPFLSTIICVILLYMTSYLVTGTILLFILMLNFYVVYRENYLKRTELYRKVQNVLVEIENAKTLCKGWQACNYPHLCSPISPCITLQWTFRDGEIVNLPWSLLVRGTFFIL